MKVSIKREELLKRLNEQLEAARQEDKAIAVKHELDEREELKQFRLNLRDALKWDYKTAKEKAGSYSYRFFNAPACPRLNTTQIQRAINCVNYDTRKNPFQVDEGSELGRALFWVPESKKLKQTVCD